MRSPDLRLFGAVVLLATSSADGHSHSVKSNLSLSSRNTSAHLPDKTQSDRGLRNGESVNGDDDEERVFDFKRLLGVDKLQQVLQWKVPLEIIKSWYRQEISPEQMFSTLGLDMVDGNLFDDLGFRAWAAYTASVSESDPAVAMLSSVKLHYTEDKLLDMLVAAKKTDTTDSIFSHLYADWLALRTTPQDVFKTLKLHEKKSSDLKHAAFARWLNYADMYNNEHKNNELQMIKVVTSYLGYLDLVQLLDKAGTKAAKKMMARLTLFWTTERKTPNQIFYDLSLYMEEDINLLARAEFRTWSKFIDRYNEAYPQQRTSVFEVLTENLGNRGLAAILVAASTMSSTEQLARELQAEQLSYWYHENKTPAYVFKMLQLGSSKNVITNPQFGLWVKYADADQVRVYGEDTPLEDQERKRKPMIVTLRWFFDDDVLANMIVEAEASKDAELLATRVKLGLFGRWARFARGDVCNKVREALKLEDSDTSDAFNPLRGIYDEFIAHAEKLKILGNDATITLSKKVEKALKRFKAVAGAKENNAPYALEMNAAEIGEEEAKKVLKRIVAERGGAAAPKILERLNAETEEVNATKILKVLAAEMARKNKEMLERLRAETEVTTQRMLRY